MTSNGTLTSLDSFTGANNGAYPYAGLVQGGDGSFYGTTVNGGTHGYFYAGRFFGYGTVFKISTSGELTNLWSFTGGNGGAFPQAGLVQGSDGCFYGTTSRINLNGNLSGHGTVFKISPSGELTNLYSFTGGNDGRPPPRRSGARQRRLFLWHD